MKGFLYSLRFWRTGFCHGNQTSNLFSLSSCLIDSEIRFWHVLVQGRPSVVFKRGCICLARGLHPIYFHSWETYILLSLEDVIKRLASSNTQSIPIKITHNLETDMCCDQLALCAAGKGNMLDYLTIFSFSRTLKRHTNVIWIKENWPDYFKIKKAILWMQIASIIYLFIFSPELSVHYLLSIFTEWKLVMALAKNI